MLLGAAKESQEIKTSYGPKGNFVVFYPGPHSYYLNDDKSKKLTSVTTMLHGCFPKFDSEAVAKKIHKKRGVSWESLVEDWRIEGEKASILGTAVHYYAEVILKANDLNAVMEGDVPPEHVEYLRALKAFIPKLWEKLEFIESEKIVFSEKYGLSGTIDLLMKSKMTGNLVLLDWKSNKEIKTSNHFQKGLGFLRHLDDCNFNHYSLQLGVYKKILLDEGYADPGKDVDLALIHLHRQKDQTVKPVFMKVRDLSNEVERIISNFSEGKPSHT